MKFKSEVQLEALNNATVDTDKFLVSDSSTVKYRTGTQLLSDLGVAGIYVPYTGATGNVDLGTHTLSSYNLIVNHTSGSGVAASITKGGNGEALTINKTSGSGNAMSVTGGLTSLVDLTLSSIPNATIDTDRFIVSDGGAIKYRTGAEVLSDIGGQAALTNPITGTGTLNFVSKFTSTGSTLGDSQIFDNGSAVGIGTTSVSNGFLNVYRSTSGTTVRFSNPSGYVDIGPNNTGGAHIYTDRPQFYMNQRLTLINGQLSSYSPNNLSFMLNSGASTAMTILNTNGYVGIGTTTPSSLLAVGGSGESAAFSVSGISGINTIATFRDIDGENVFLTAGKISDSSIDIAFGDVNSAYGLPYYRINSNYHSFMDGSVGIGTTNPSALLNVYGNLHLGAYSNLSTVNIENRTGKSIFSISTDGVNNAVGTTITYSWADGGHGPLKFNNASGEVMRLDYSGKLGVGTTNPTSRIHSVTTSLGPVSYDNRCAIFGYNAGVSTVYPNSVGVAGKVLTSDGRAIYGDATTGGGWGGYFDGKGHFSGSVGIGTVVPAYSLDVNGVAMLRNALYMTAGGSGSTPAWSFSINGSGDLVVDEAIVTRNFVFSNAGQVLIGTTISGTPTYGSTPQFVTSSSTGGVIDIKNNNTTIGTGALLGRVQFTGKSDTAVGYTAAAIDVITSTNAGTGSSGGGILRFMTALAGGGQAPTARMWINQAGYVTIGSTNTASHPLRVTTQVSNISIYADYDIVALSDQSVKENIRPIENVIERVQKSRGVLYDRIDSGEKDNIGFIAQELEVAFPELVSTNEDGTKAVKYQNAVAVLFEAVKEQQKQIDEIKQILNGLTN